MIGSFTFDANKCTGCGACRVACTIENGLAPDVSWRRIETFNPQRRSIAPVFHLSLACNHCATAACMHACPALAYRRDDGDGGGAPRFEPVHWLRLLLVGVPLRRAGLRRGGRRHDEVHVVRRSASSRAQAVVRGALPDRRAGFRRGGARGETDDAVGSSGHGPPAEPACHPTGRWGARDDCEQRRCARHL